MKPFDIMGQYYSSNSIIVFFLPSSITISFLASECIRKLSRSLYKADVNM
jgi:hypothetical protein